MGTPRSPILPLLFPSVPQFPHPKWETDFPTLPPQPRLPSQTYRPVGGWQEPGGHKGGPPTCTFPPVWAWGRRYTQQQQEQFQNPVRPPAPAEPLAPGRVSVAGLGGLQPSFASRLSFWLAFPSRFSLIPIVSPHLLFQPLLFLTSIFSPHFSSPVFPSQWISPLFVSP